MRSTRKRGKTGYLIPSWVLRKEAEQEYFATADWELPLPYEPTQELWIINPNQSARYKRRDLEAIINGPNIPSFISEYIVRTVYSMAKYDRLTEKQYKLITNFVREINRVTA